jgi:hypothetical protein
MNHKQLMLITGSMPMKAIQVNGEDYLQRYYAGEANGEQHWLHRFMRADSERHLHSHPWWAKSTILCGWYREECLNKDGRKYESDFFEGDINSISPDRVHRIVQVMPNTWTHMVVFSERREEWHFIDDDGNKEIVRSSPLDWWRSCGPRPTR